MPAALAPASLGYAFSLGLVAACNPCGLPLLPAYLSFFVDRGGEIGPGRGARVGRALLAGACTTIGFLVVFGVIGAAVEGGASLILGWVPWVMVVVAVAMVVLGAVTLAGRHLRIGLPRIPVGVGVRRPRSMAVFGVSYGVASLTCTLPLFLAAVAGAFTTRGPVAGVTSLLAYGLGMGVFLTALAVALAVAGVPVVHRLRRVSRLVGPLQGGILILAGAYLAYYWTASIVAPTRTPGVSRVVDQVQAGLSGGLSAVAVPLGATLGGLLVVALVWLALGAPVPGRLRHGRARPASAGATGPSPGRPETARAAGVPAGGEGHCHREGGETHEEAGHAPGHRQPAPRPVRRRVLAGSTGVLSAGLLAIALFGFPGGASSQPPVRGTGATGGPAPTVGPAGSRLLHLDRLGPGAVHPAPGFNLVDQHGKPVSLASLRGKVVVLSFNDDRCQDLCPLYAGDVTVANEDLGSAAAHVAFVSINVNPFFPRVADVASWSTQHNLEGVPNWSFLTASPAKLRAVWHAYGEEVAANSATRNVNHGPLLDFIGPSGRIRALGQFGDASADTAGYARALAAQAADLLPGPERPAHLGSVGAGGTGGGGARAVVDRVAPGFELPELSSPARRLGPAQLRGRPAVVNFWATTCSACKGELPALQQVHAALGTRVGFVGVDVLDHSGAARAFAHRAGATYPLVADAAGRVAARYGVADLPMTVILGPQGRVRVRHVGALTAPELRYLLGTTFPSLAPGGGHSGG
ncbi:MAG TPA: redoxin domain-containing protein [Acidimicrobiales bacterium]|nr:redoxin domain-containing protein [Acidimicrobiales bacterium]